VFELLAFQATGTKEEEPGMVVKRNTLLIKLFRETKYFTSVIRTRLDQSINRLIFFGC
jgi:hypothetical protein